MQMVVLNYLKVLCSKGIVLNVQVKRIVNVSGGCNGADPPRQRIADDVSKGLFFDQIGIPKPTGLI